MRAMAHVHAVDDDRPILYYGSHFAFLLSMEETAAPPVVPRPPPPARPAPRRAVTRARTPARASCTTGPGGSFRPFITAFAARARAASVEKMPPGDAFPSVPSRAIAPPFAHGPGWHRRASEFVLSRPPAGAPMRNGVRPGLGRLDHGNRKHDDDGAIGCRLVDPGPKRHSRTSCSAPLSAPGNPAGASRHVSTVSRSTSGSDRFTSVTAIGTTGVSGWQRPHTTT